MNYLTIRDADGLCDDGRRQLMTQAACWLTDENGDSRADNTAAWHDLNFSINMGAFGKVPLGGYDIFLKINDPKETSTNKRCIQFANHDIWNTSLGANLIGSTRVAP
jgi:hypothetical protein